MAGAIRDGGRVAGRCDDGGIAALRGPRWLAAASGSPNRRMKPRRGRRRSRSMVERRQLEWYSDIGLVRATASARPLVPAPTVTLPVAPGARCRRNACSCPAQRREPLAE